jgi:hypothetical protein
VYFILAARALGLDCGPMSGFDNEAVDREFFPGGQVVDHQFLTSLPMVRTSRGKHVYFRMSDPVGKQTLAKRPIGTDEKGKTSYDLLAETRGEGGLALAPPSLHPSGMCYTVEQILLLFLSGQSIRRKQCSLQHAPLRRRTSRITALQYLGICQGTIGGLDADVAIKWDRVRKTHLLKLFSHTSTIGTRFLFMLVLVK